MKKPAFLSSFLCVLMLAATTANAQQFDAAFGISGVKAPSASDGLNSTNFSPQSIGGGVFPVFSGDFLFKKHIGVGGEVFWRATRNLYQAFGAEQPFRPIFYDFNAVWAPKLGKRAAAEFAGGFGGESSRFYTSQITCSFTSCSNFVSSNHLLGHVGGGLRLYAWHNIFVRPEAHYYFIRHNFEFSGSNVIRAGVSIGYSSGADY